MTCAQKQAGSCAAGEEVHRLGLEVFTHSPLAVFFHREVLSLLGRWGGVCPGWGIPGAPRCGDPRGGRCRR